VTVGAAAVVLSLMPGAAHAGAWTDFEVRCLSALEAQVPPVVAGLGQGARAGDVTRYALPEGRELRVDAAPADGMRACAVHDPAGAPVPGFDAWIAEAVAAGRYVATGPATWHSNLWIEPVLEVGKRTGDGALTLRIVETRLEA
jgi:hypothetical protein